MRVQKGTAVQILTEPFDATPSSVSATVTRADGTSATAPTTTVESSTGRVKVSLTAANHTNQLDRLTVEVSATVDTLATKQVIEVEVVGSFYCTLGALRLEPRLDDQNRYPDWLLAEMRDELEDYIEESAQVAFVPRYGRVSLVGDGTDTLRIRQPKLRSIRSITIDGVSQTLTDFEILDGGILHRKSGYWFDPGDPVVVEYEHGYDRPPPKLVREMKHAIRTQLQARGSNVPNDRLWEQTPDGLTVRFSTADAAARRFVGSASVDAAINLYAWPRIGIG